MSLNPNYWKAQRIRGILRKIELVNYLGGCCSKCGYKDNLAVLEFHHIDESTKEFQLDVKHLSNTSKKMNNYKVIKK